MPLLVQRNCGFSDASPKEIPSGFLSSDRGGRRSGNNKGRQFKSCLLNSLVQLLVCLATIYAFHVVGLTDPETDIVASLNEGVELLTGEKGFEIAPMVFLKWYFAAGEQPHTISLGPHEVILRVGRSCENPGFWMRLEGSALVGVNLKQGMNKDIWRGKFMIPMDGKYMVVVHWYGCDGQSLMKEIRMGLVKVMGSKSNYGTEPLCSRGAWVTANRFPGGIAQVSQPFVWFNPYSHFKIDFISAGNSVIAKEALLGPNHDNKFEWLESYENLCWIGSESAESIWKAFLALSKLVSDQPSSKFQYYPSHSIVEWDSEWDHALGTSFRSCKIILVSIDEIREPTSQQDYKLQVETFLNQLVNAFPDDTFPILMFTMMESPERPSQCHNLSLGRSTEHPCNVALKNLFQKSPFPRRVQLLDNTDVTLPQLGENKKDSILVVASRIFVCIGKILEEWKLADQGKIQKRFTAEGVAGQPLSDGRKVQETDGAGQTGFL